MAEIRRSEVKDMKEKKQSHTHIKLKDEKETERKEETNTGK